MILRAKIKAKSLDVIVLHVKKVLVLVAFFLNVKTGPTIFHSIQAWTPPLRK